ncbi:MAG: MBL fold metallo-hydrolase [Parachlamydiales bacterium]|jgi:phosphoribosyl 1,2-cyclic phosphate phosphodiesterase
MKEIVVLGSGASTGTPVIGCKCKTCSSLSRYNKRSRPAILIKEKNKNILVDCGPDIRSQALKYNMNKLDGLIITHNHYDHIAGIDDLRIYNRIQKKSLKCFLLKGTYEEIKKKYAYFFEPNLPGHTQSAKFDFNVLSEKKSCFCLDNMSFDYFSYFQDSKKVLGFRLNKFAYVTDIKKYDESIFSKLKDLDVLLLSCLRIKESDVHFNLRQALDFIKIVKPKKTYLTHLGHELEYAEISSQLPKNVKLAYDGLIIKTE